jgi:hypothetical protein
MDPFCPSTYYAMWPASLNSLGGFHRQSHQHWAVALFVSTAINLYPILVSSHTFLSIPLNWISITREKAIRKKLRMESGSRPADAQVIEY